MKTLLIIWGGLFSIPVILSARFIPGEGFTLEANNSPIGLAFFYYRGKNEIFLLFAFPSFRA
jgi:hypothetical protein